jgi:hypothetical protein
LETYTTQAKRMVEPNRSATGAIYMPIA